MMSKPGAAPWLRQQRPALLKPCGPLLQVGEFQQEDERQEIGTG
jgi:hypothetical protein